MPKTSRKIRAGYDLTSRLNLRISPGLLKVLKREAVERDLTLSRLSIDLIERGLRRASRAASRDGAGAN